MTSRSGIRPSAAARPTASPTPSPCELTALEPAASSLPMTNRCVRPGAGGSATTASTTTASDAPVHASIMLAGSPSLYTS